MLFTLIKRSSYQTYSSKYKHALELIKTNFIPTERNPYNIPKFSDRQNGLKSVKEQPNKGLHCYSLCLYLLEALLLRKIFFNF